LRKCVLSVPPALMVGMTGMPGQKSGVSFSTACMISWCSGEGVLSTGPPNGVIEIPLSASTRFSVAYTSLIGLTRQDAAIDRGARPLRQGIHRHAPLDLRGNAGGAHLRVVDRVGRQASDR